MTLVLSGSTSGSKSTWTPISSFSAAAVIQVSSASSPVTVTVGARGHGGGVRGQPGVEGDESRPVTGPARAGVVNA